LEVNKIRGYGTKDEEKKKRVTEKIKSVQPEENDKDR
jgi:hypothetical protein